MNRPRGLCWNCYYTPGVLPLYPSTSKFARRGVGNHTGERPLPVPTTEEPGTEEKMAVLAQRAEAGLALFHPEDSRIVQPRGTRARGRIYADPYRAPGRGCNTFGDIDEYKFTREAS